MPCDKLLTTVSPVRACCSCGHSREPGGFRGEVLCLRAATLLMEKQRCRGMDAKQSGFSKDEGEKLGFCCAVVNQNSDGLRERDHNFKGVSVLQLVSRHLKAPAAVCWRSLLCQQP